MADEEIVLSKRVPGLGEVHLTLTGADGTDRQVVKAEIIYDVPRDLGVFINEGALLMRSGGPLPAGHPSAAQPARVGGPVRLPCGGKRP